MASTHNPPYVWLLIKLMAGVQRLTIAGQARASTHHLHRDIARCARHICDVRLMIITSSIHANLNDYSNIQEHNLSKQHAHLNGKTLTRHTRMQHDAAPNADLQQPNHSNLRFGVCLHKISASPRTK